MKKFLALILTVFSVLFSLIGCNSGDTEIPDGLQIVDENKVGGYIFFGPENWVVSNRGGVSSSYVSAINTTSISFTKAQAPTGDWNEYFATNMSALPYEITIITNGEACTFGNNGNAMKFVYTYKYQNYDFAAMQILTQRGEDFYIFTYNSYGNPSDENSDYRRHLKSVQLAIDSFKFTDKSATSVEPSYSTDEDGYVLVSDRKVSGFDLYLPSTYTVIDNAAIVTAKISNNANVSISKATQTNVSILTYLQTRRAELSEVVNNVTDIRISVPTAVDTEGKFFEDWSMDVLPTLDESIVFGDLPKTNAVTYEYTYEYSGTKYHVYQVLGVDSYNGYVFTYTATEDEYETHINEIMTILRKVKF